MVERFIGATRYPGCTGSALDFCTKRGMRGSFEVFSGVPITSGCRLTLVYNLPATNAIYQRFVGIDGSAYIVGGFGMTALTANNIVLVPIRSGIGLRLGANVGYLKFTPRATWNPF